jgi:hypothetical protein
MALDGTGQALIQRSQGLADAKLWEEQQYVTRNYSEQQKATKNRGGGLLRAIGSVVGSAFGGPAGGAIGGMAGNALGGLFG